MNVCYIVSNDRKKLKVVINVYLTVNNKRLYHAVVNTYMVSLTLSNVNKLIIRSHSATLPNTHYKYINLKC